MYRGFRARCPQLTYSCILEIALSTGVDHDEPVFFIAAPKGRW